jgi:hypothetical protein
MSHLISDLARHRPDIAQQYWSSSIVAQATKVFEHRDNPQSMPFDTEDEEEEEEEDDDEEGPKLKKKEEEKKPEIKIEDPLLQPQSQPPISPDDIKITKLLAEQGFQAALAALATADPSAKPTPPTSPKSSV